MKTTVTFDFKEALAGVEKLDAIKYPLARSMAVAGGSALRDEAKQRAPVGTDSQNPGSLRDAIYLAFRDKASTDTTVRYSVSWNARKAPHGHLVEFGHWQPFVVFHGEQGWRTLAKGKGARATGVRRSEPKWIPAVPFLRPAYDAILPKLPQIMAERGRKRFAELMQDQLIPENSV